MENAILGLHHVTAIAGNAQENLDFYTKVLGQRLVKKTVNFDDPGTYHFYFGNESGEPGTILTFFPWEGIGKGYNGSGMVTNISYAVPDGSLDFWQERFLEHGIKHGNMEQRFGEQILPFEDPDGLSLQFVVPTVTDTRLPWDGSNVKADVATKGFHSVTLTVKNLTPTARILTDLFGYSLQQQDGAGYRFAAGAAGNAAIVDIIEAPQLPPGRGGAGTNHHVAFRVKNEEVLMAYREKIASKGINITPKIDRDYFFSLYFREPGGVLFELATDNPGFTRDEPLDELGTSLKLPKQYESNRAAIEEVLPVLHN